MDGHYSQTAGVANIMPFRIRMELDGVSDLFARLKELPKKLSKKHLKKAVNNVSKRVLWSAKSKVPKDTGLLRRSLGRKVKVYANSGVVVGVVGARTGYREVAGTRTRGKAKGQAWYRNPVKYLHIVELGTARSKAYHALRDSLTENAGLMREELVKAFDAAASEAAKGK